MLRESGLACTIAKTIPNDLFRPGTSPSRSIVLAGPPSSPGFIRPLAGKGSLST
jgi:hypothetical protein